MSPLCADSDSIRVGVREDEREDLLGVVHDLRQPVAAMRYVLSLVRGRADLPCDVSTRLDQLDGYTRWMSDLLRLSVAAPAPLADDRRVRRDGLPRQRTRTPVVELGPVTTTTASLAGQAYEGHLVLESSGTAVVEVEETDLRRALGNLLDNAFRAAGPVGTVRVRVGAYDRSAFVSVDDDGPGFGGVGSGSRVGLSVVAHVAVAAGGGLEITGSDLGGARVVLRLPVHDPSRVGALS